jgi:oxygen-independent coproporphyrinogen-3 oxidase
VKDSLGVYISVPFCKAKCTYCNFASGVFGAERMDRYVDRVCGEIARVRDAVTGMGAALPDRVDTMFLGGGTPSLLSADQVRRLFAAVRNEFDVATDAEVTLECAPGQLSEETLDEMLRLGMNRISFGVQSFVDAEAKAVGRLHTRAMCLAEIDRMRAAGVEQINLDLIVGLPGQTAASWRESVQLAVESGVPHVSVYMLEVDEDSRLGREMLRVNTSVGEGLAARYGAATAPTEDETADWYGDACGWLEAAGVRQYEISNFAREGHASRHNLKYWRREPYLGFGLDAHSMLRTGSAGRRTDAHAVRWANSSGLDDYLAVDAEDLSESGAATPEIELIGKEQAFEETLFLGLRMKDGVDLKLLRAEFGAELADAVSDSMREMEEAGMLVVERGRACLTAAGRMASNEVFSRLLVEVPA